MCVFYQHQHQIEIDRYGMIVRYVILVSWQNTLQRVLILFQYQYYGPGKK